MLCVTIMLPIGCIAQSIVGKVLNSKNQPIVGANIVWINYKKGTNSKKDGSFVIAKQNEIQLIASYSGYHNDTITITNADTVLFVLYPKNDLEQAVVTAEKNGILISAKNPIKTEIITSLELKKSACCDLAGCFETQSSVQPQTTNVITNAKELRILGLSGVYNQVLIDGFPMI